MFDVIVIGAGPAGAEAAITARKLDLAVLVIDEESDAGGQIYRPGAFSASEGTALRRRLADSGAQCLFGHRVWNVRGNFGDVDRIHPQIPASAGNSVNVTGIPPKLGFEVSTVGPGGSTVVKAQALIIATGAIERFYPRPGWTLPGVIGLGAATIMLKTHDVLPGKRTLVFGPGPLAPLVANLIIEKGGSVVALADPNPRSVWLSALPSLATRPDLLWQGATWMTRLIGRGVPILHGWDIESFGGSEQVESVTLKSQGDQRTFNVDAVCFSHGLYPSTEFYRLLGAALEYDADRGGWIPRLGDGQRTSVPRLYAAGDGAALSGVAAAPLTGRIAALSTAQDLGRRVEHLATPDLERALTFGREMARLMRPRAEAMRDVPDDTIVCRCEDVTAREIRMAIVAGSTEMNALKSATRCGMGPCGGRMCSEAAFAMMECAGLQRDAIGYWTARPPLRPVPIDALIGDFDYSDIPIREPAPL